MMPRAWCAALAGVVLGLCAVPAHAIQQAFLVQNSGWMEPFYADPQSQFKPLIAAVANAAARPGDKVMVLAFSQSSGSNVSPQLLGRWRRPGGRLAGAARACAQERQRTGRHGFSRSGHQDHR
jgi:hypothetical protein